MATMATASEIFNKKYTQEEIIPLINQTPIINAMVTLSQFSTEMYREEDFRRNFAQLFLENIQTLPTQDISQELQIQIKNDFKKLLPLINQRIIFSQQSLLNLWKWLIAFSDEDNIKIEHFGNTNITNLGNLLYHLCMITNDYFFDESKTSTSDLNAQIFSSAYFNNSENLLSSITRTFIIFTEIAADSTLFKEKDFVNINEDFESANHYTLKEYISVIFGLLSWYFKSLPLSDISWIQNSETYFSNSKLNEISKSIIDSLSISPSELKDWALNNIDKPWNFMKFKEKPLIALNETSYLPINIKLLHQHFFEGLFHKIRHIYPQNDKSFLDFYGKPFEKYAQNLLDISATNSTLNYSITPEFEYVYKKNTLDSPDIFLKLGNKLLVIEVKSYRLRLQSIIESDINTINKDMEKMIIKPLKQAHDRINELIKINHNVMNGIDEVYLMVVTQGHFPTLAPFERQIRHELNSHFSIPIKDYYHLDIEEFEMLCSLIERKRPIFKVLNNKSLYHNQNTSFKNFAFENSYFPKSNKYLSDKFLDVAKEIQRIVF